MSILLRDDIEEVLNTYWGQHKVLDGSETCYEMPSPGV